MSLYNKNTRTEHVVLTCSTLSVDIDQRPIRHTHCEELAPIRVDAVQFHIGQSSVEQRDDTAAALDLRPPSVAELVG